jgi:hypothetical protein
MASVTKAEQSFPIKVTEPKRPSGRILSIPTYYGGEGVLGELSWVDAFRALRQLAKSDPVLSLIANQLDNAWADCVDSFCSYGMEIGPDAERSLDDISDEEFEVRTGKARKA